MSRKLTKMLLETLTKLPKNFQTKIEVSSTGCWLWIGIRKKTSDYGHVLFRGRWLGAHRVVYSLLVSNLTLSQELHHKLTCPKNCVNPEHLEVTTKKYHEDAAPTLNRNKTHCPRGHEYSINNTIIQIIKAKNSSKVYKTRKCRLCESKRKSN